MSEYVELNNIRLGKHCVQNIHLNNEDLAMLVLNNGDIKLLLPIKTLVLIEEAIHKFRMEKEIIK